MASVGAATCHGALSHTLCCGTTTCAELLSLIPEINPWFYLRKEIKCSIRLALHSLNTLLFSQGRESLELEKHQMDLFNVFGIYILAQSVNYKNYKTANSKAGFFSNCLIYVTMHL